MVNGGDADVLKTLPPWIRALFVLVFQYGLASAVMVGLVWILTGKVLSNQEEILRQLRQHEIDVKAAGSEMRSFAEEMTRANERLIYLQRQTCFNTAGSNTARQDKCLTNGK